MTPWTDEQLASFARDFELGVPGPELRRRYDKTWGQIAGVAMRQHLSRPPTGEAMILPANHDAVRQSRTLFESRVRGAQDIWGLGLPFLGWCFERDHSTISHGIAAVERRLAENGKLKIEITMLRERCLQAALKAAA